MIGDLITNRNSDHPFAKPRLHAFDRCIHFVEADLAAVKLLDGGPTTARVSGLLHGAEQMHPLVVPAQLPALGLEGRIYLEDRGGGRACHISCSDASFSGLLCQAQ